MDTIKVVYKCPGCGEKKSVECLEDKFSDAVCITCATVRKIKVGAPVKMWEPSN